MWRDRSGRVVVVFDLVFSRKTPSMDIIKETSLAIAATEVDDDDDDYSFVFSLEGLICFGI